MTCAYTSTDEIFDCIRRWEKLAVQKLQTAREKPLLEHGVMERLSERIACRVEIKSKRIPNNNNYCY